MALTNLLLQLKPEEIPEYMRGQFFELHSEPKYDSDGIQLNPDTYVGWVHITISRHYHRLCGIIILCCNGITHNRLVFRHVGM